MFDGAIIKHAETQFETTMSKERIESALADILEVRGYTLDLVYITKAGTSIYTFKYADIEYQTLKGVEDYLINISV